MWRSVALAVSAVLALVLAAACGRVNGDSVAASRPSDAGAPDGMPSGDGTLAGDATPSDDATSSDDTPSPPSDDGASTSDGAIDLDASVATSDGCSPVQDAGGGQPVTILQSPDGVYGFAVAGEDVYWSTATGGTDSGAVFAAKISPCPAAPVTLATGQAYAFPVLVNPTDVYWPTFGASVPVDAAGRPADAAVLYGPTGGTVARCARGGCGGKPTLLESDWLPDGLGLAEGGIYSNLSDGTDPATGVRYAPSIVQCPLAGCGATPTVLTSLGGQGGLPAWPARGFALDRGDAFFFSNTNGDLLSCSVSNCSATLDRVAPRPWPYSQGGGAGIYAITGFDALNVYWYDTPTVNAGGFGPVTCPRAGCSEPSLLSVDPVTVPAGKNIAPTGEVIVDATSVYWLTVPAFYPWEAPLPGSTLSRCSIANCSTTVVVLATGLVAPYGLAQDDVYLYWAEESAPAANGSIYLEGPASIKRLPK